MFCTWCGVREYRQPGRRAKKFVTLGVNVCGPSVGITDRRVRFRLKLAGCSCDDAASSKCRMTGEFEIILNAAVRTVIVRP